MKTLEMRVREIWASLNDLTADENQYKVATRLGYKNAEEMWLDDKEVRIVIYPYAIELVK